MRTIIANAFSVNMLKHDAMLFFTQIDLEIAKFIAHDDGDVHSIVGHEATANLLSVKLELEVPYNRENYRKEKDDRIIVCLPNKRLEEGKILSVEELLQIDVKFWLIK